MPIETSPHLTDETDQEHALSALPTRIGRAILFRRSNGANPTA
jgi:hypothetical protein